MSLKWESFPNESSNLCRTASMLKHSALIIHCGMTYPRRYFSILYYSVTNIWLTCQFFLLEPEGRGGCSMHGPHLTVNTLWQAATSPGKPKSVHAFNLEFSSSLWSPTSNCLLFQKGFQTCLSIYYLSQSLWISKILDVKILNPQSTYICI
jgi:hypothetical protein